LDKAIIKPKRISALVIKIVLEIGEPMTTPLDQEIKDIV
jgi:hypothetical protein|tara:strand:+ start:1744 stop:1860 length:117 start_codon:yes stop_codon:yes gene_type:complete